MKLTKSILVVLFISIAFAFKPFDGIQSLEIGSSIPNADKKMADVKGKMVSINDVMEKKGVLVMFSCNTCPYVIKTQSRTKELISFTKKNKIGMIIINSNEAKRDTDDSMEAMKKYSKSQGYSCAYVVDENSAMADAFGATRTPEVFLFDNNGKLVYKGAIDDNHSEPKNVTDKFLQKAITAVANGQKVNPESTKSVGCSIKRKS